MKICFLGGFSGGGTEKSCFIIANELCKYHSVFILENGKHNPFFHLSPNINFYKLKYRDIVRRNIEVYSFIKNNKIDLLITLEATTGIISLVPAKLARCKHIVWEHANYYQTQGNKYIKKIRGLELKLADAYIVLTKRDLNNFKRNFKIKSAIDYIYNPIDFVPVTEYDTESKTIISAGHIRKIKNFIVIPDIAKIVFEKHPSWKWKIFGNTAGEECEKLKKKIYDYGLEKNIFLCGRCDNMSDEYSKSAMYVMTSLQEGLPMVLLEAKAHKLPIVSFDIETGPDEIIRDGVNGYLVDPYNVHAMAEKMITLIENDSLRQAFSDDSVLDLEKFDKERIIEKWRILLEGLYLES